jgi:hypothetical protein
MAQQWAHPQWTSSVNLGWGSRTTTQAAAATQGSNECVPATSLVVVRDDPFAPRFAVPRLPKYQITDPSTVYSRREIKNAHARLHVSPTRNTSAHRIANSGLIRQQERNTRPLSSNSFFRPNKFDTNFRPRELKFAHEYRVVRKPSPEVQRQYISWSPEKPRPRSPLRIVRHEYKGFPLRKRNPDVSPAGVARKPDGTYFAN